MRRRRDGYPMLELQLGTDPGLPKTHGKRIKACGGEYREARGGAWRRYVFLPCTRTGLALAAELITRYGSKMRRNGATGWAEADMVNSTPVLLRWGLLSRTDIPIRYGVFDLRAWIAKQGRRASVEKQRRKAEAVKAAKARIDRQRLVDVDMMHGASLEAGERLASEFIFGMEA